MKGNYKNRASKVLKILKKENLEYFELLLKIAAFIVGAYWTYFIFKYQYVILPNTEPTSLILKSNIRKVGFNDSLDFYQIEIGVQNKSKMRVKVPSSFYNIAASKVNKAILPLIRFKAGNLSKDDVYLNNFFKHDTSQTRIVQTNRILDDESYISPEGEFQIQHSFALPKNFFDILDINLSTISSKKEANILVKWKYDEIGRVSSDLFIIRNHFIGKPDTTEYNYDKEKPYAEKFDIYFTNLRNDYFIKNVDFKINDK